MLTVFYSPHSTSADNEAGRASGHADVPLSPLGRQQAWELGQHYTRQAIDAVFCSDLQRASATAEIAFSGRALPVVRDVRLRECNFGKLTQCSPLQLEEERHITEPYPDGESILMVVQRVGGFLRDALHQYDGKRIVVIGHRATKHGLEYWCGDASLEEIVRTRWQWRDIPIWRYELHARDLERHAVVGVLSQRHANETK